MGWRPQRPPRNSLNDRAVDWSQPKYVSFTTFRADGTRVATPVWLAPLDDGFAFTTDPLSWKVRRLAKDSRFEMQPCSVRGHVAEHAPLARGTATVIDTASDYARVVDALKKKYGLMVTLVEWGGAIKQRVLRRTAPDCAVVLRIEP